MQTFHNLNIESLRGAIVILDVDGTLVCDGSLDVKEENEYKLKMLISLADVYLCSNGLISRTEYLAKKYGINYIRNTFKKPNKKVLEGIDFRNRRVVIIGDKFITDGLLAYSIHSEFLKIDHLRCSKDGLKVQISYFIDTIIWFLFSLFK